MADLNALSHWRRTKKLMLFTIGAWGVLSIGMPFLVPLLNLLNVPNLDVPLGFFMSTQGAPIAFPVCAAARPHRPGSFQRRRIEHVPQKWAPVLRKRACSNKEIEQVMALRSYSSDQLRRICGSCALGFLLCIIVLALLDARGFGGKLAATIIALVPLALFCAAGLATSTADPLEFQIAGRRISAPFAGMAAAHPRFFWLHLHLSSSQAMTGGRC
jgi:putative solute:sodium symporter small subunit